ncbi:MAG: autotransporter outer membrane beta-barrel domain-containing protein [Verrucomicrobiales bacterium]|jgi:outer membrane autotransporter protein|nr:autotransporter outer membrane beta-barrel domain-containing protein [Verrucomicrobiales bacterium]
MNPKLTLLTLCALSVSALNVLADVKYVTPGQDITETDQTYEAVTGSNALSVTGGTYTGTNITLSSTVSNADAAYAVDQGALLLTGGTVTSNSDAGTVHGVAVTNTSAARLENVSVVVSGSRRGNGIYILNSSTVSINGGSIAVSGEGGANGHYGLAAGLNTRIEAEDLLVTVSATKGISITADEAGAWVELKKVTVRSQAQGLVVQRDGTIIGDQVTVEANANALSVVHGGMFVLDNSTLTATGTVPVIRINNTNNGSGGHLEINGGTLTGHAGLLHVSGSTDNISNQVTLNNVDTTGVTGDNSINVSGDNTSTTVDINSGTGGLNGNITNSGSGALTVNLNNSALTGDVINAGDGVLVITLDNNSVGTGGFNGGDLITGENSVWTFDKDSHGNYGKNDGVWNIGDYDVTFDNLKHTGTINLSVNSDTGEGGSITVETADGEGTVHINTTGNGQLNPNDVLPGIVSGDGTENWQWDPIDWGIDEIIKDGDHFIKQGTTPAGAVLNSAIAVQQSLWFAQQNSLLKRMGDLRYGARASRPLADKDVRVPYNSLIDNIWIRSYGQQLNVGSQVSGKAYEQLIYGVDLGTDHKFTISADSDLYLGIYAGYGRSDLDYRTPGTDGEINSYYGGLYATWLHASGFYIDATFKAASVNNDLKAPYSGSQITANYSDVNLGGSLEIGHKFTFADDWFIEPQFQVNYLHILAENYQAGPMTISAQDLDALQLRLGSLFGRSIKLANSGALQPYIKISGVETISSGGTIKNGYQHTRANTDGARAEVGGGIIWQLDADNQLHLDYEASFGDKYDKPWGLTAGYRHQF